jgi:hypothetical protein
MCPAFVVLLLAVVSVRGQSDGAVLKEGKACTTGGLRSENDLAPMLQCHPTLPYVPLIIYRIDGKHHKGQPMIRRMNNPLKHKIVVSLKAGEHAISVEHFPLVPTLRSHPATVTFVAEPGHTYALNFVDYGACLRNWGWSVQTAEGLSTRAVESWLWLPFVSDVSDEAHPSIPNQTHSPTIAEAKMMRAAKAVSNSFYPEATSEFFTVPPGPFPRDVQLSETCREAN